VIVTVVLTGTEDIVPGKNGLPFIFISRFSVVKPLISKFISARNVQFSIVFMYGGGEGGGEGGGGRKGDNDETRALVIFVVNVQKGVHTLIEPLLTRETTLS
jgi:hypothetical protein